MDRSVPVFYLRRKDTDEPIDDLNILSFEYEDVEKKTDLLKLTIENNDLRWFDAPLFRQNNLELVVSWGYPGHMSQPRNVVLQSIQGAQTLTLEFHGKGILMHKVVRKLTHEGLSYIEIVRRIATSYGYGNSLFLKESPAAIEPRPHVSQEGTDYAFVMSLAAKLGYEFYIDWDGFHWEPKNVDAKPTRKLAWMLPPDVGDMISFSIEKQTFTTAGQASVAARDPKLKTQEKANANDTTTRRPVVAPESVAVYTRPSGGGMQRVNRAPPAVALSQPSAPTTATTAKAQAAGQFVAGQMSAVLLTFDMVGDPTVNAKTVIDVTGLGERLSGRYYLTEVKHSISTSGYKLSCKAKREGVSGKKAGDSKAQPNKEPPPPGAPPGATVPPKDVARYTRPSGGVMTREKRT